MLPSSAAPAATGLSLMRDDPYVNIQNYAKEFKSALNVIGHGVEPATNYLDETLAVVMDKDSLDKLFALSPTVAAIIGIHNGKLTVAMLAVDDTTYAVKDEHRNGTPGQQVWPVVIPVRNLNTFLS
jgi:hypothetical protein